jgi:hypothetical protein
MTNRDPYDQDRMYDPERPVPSRSLEPQGEGWAVGAISAAAIGVLLILVGIMYALTDRPVTTANTPPASSSAPSTTGQGADRNVPARPVEEDLAPPGQPGR